MKNNIILVGMMGAGKSFIGKELKNSMPEMTHVDLDEYIERKKNMKIAEIFKNFGEEYFRKLESEAITELCKNCNLIISLGGGAYENSQNRVLLNASGYTIYLKASAEVLFNRIKNEKHRPLLKDGFGKEKIEEILDKRKLNYEKAMIAIDTTDKNSYNIVEEIKQRIAEYDR